MLVGLLESYFVLDENSLTRNCTVQNNKSLKYKQRISRKYTT